MHSRFIFNHIDFKNAWAREESLWLPCFKRVTIENKTRSLMNKGGVLKRDNNFVAAYEQPSPWQYVPFQVLSLLAQSKCPSWADTKVLYTATGWKLLKWKWIFQQHLQSHHVYFNTYYVPSPTKFLILELLFHLRGKKLIAPFLSWCLSLFDSSSTPTSRLAMCRKKRCFSYSLNYLHFSLKGQSNSTHASRCL